PVPQSAKPTVGSALLGVRVAAARLGQTAADHVADGQDHGIEPDPVRPEYVVVASVAGGACDGAGDEDPSEHHHVGDEFGGPRFGATRPVGPSKRVRPVNRAFNVATCYRLANKTGHEAA